MLYCYLLPVMMTVNRNGLVEIVDVGKKTRLKNPKFG